MCLSFTSMHCTKCKTLSVAHFLALRAFPARVTGFAIVGLCILQQLHPYSCDSTASVLCSLLLPSQRDMFQDSDITEPWPWLFLSVCPHAQNCSAHMQKLGCSSPSDVMGCLKTFSPTLLVSRKNMHAVQTLAWPWTEAVQQGWHRDKVQANQQKLCHRWSTYCLAPGTPMNSLQHCYTCCAIPARWQVRSEGCNKCCQL